MPAPDFLPEHLEGMFLVIGATDDPEVNRRISLESRSRNLLCNIVDKPRVWNFIVPSQVHRGDLVIAVSTGGRSPALAKKIRQDLEILFPDIYSSYVVLLGQVREYLLAQGFTQAKNQQIFELLIEAPILESIKRGDREELTNQLMRLLDPPPRPEEVEGWLRELDMGSRINATVPWRVPGKQANNLPGSGTFVDPGFKPTLRKKTK